VANWNEGIIEEFRANEGRVGGYFDGATVLLLHTTGRRTGREHVTPAVYLSDGDRWVVIGSKGGAPADPDWVRNLEANAEATIEVGCRDDPGPDDRDPPGRTGVGRPVRPAGRAASGLRRLPGEDGGHQEDPRDRVGAPIAPLSSAR
jgi:hypothetical protein